MRTGLFQAVALFVIGLGSTTTHAQAPVTISVPSGTAMVVSQERATMGYQQDPTVLQMGGGTPINDNCVDAEVVDLLAGISVTRFGDNTGATDEFGFGNSVYEAFTSTECLDVTISYCGTVPPFGGAFTFLFVNCPLDNLVYIGDNYISETACGDGNYSLTFPQIPPGTYYYGVLQYVDATGPYELTFTGAACTAVPPLNDECLDAIELIPGQVCDLTMADVMGATVSGGSEPPISCTNVEGNAADDVWFQFEATAEEHTVSVQPSVGFAAIVDVRSGPCGASVTIACADLAPGEWVADQSVLVTGLTIGEVYFVRVYDWFAGLPLTTTFGICVLGPEPAECGADAGSLTATEDEVVLEAGSADISAIVNADPVIPTGSELIHVLTTGTELVIMELSASPMFTVDALGIYTIHSLVYDPTTLDLSGVEFGVTTAFDLSALMIQGGGEICAVLDMTGAQTEVVLTLQIGAHVGLDRSVYPNPSNGDLTIQYMGGATSATISLMDMTGRLVYGAQTRVNADQRVSLPLAGQLAAGTYLLNSSSEVGQFQQLVVIH